MFLSKAKEVLNESIKRNRRTLIIVVCVILALVLAHTIPAIINPIRRSRPMLTNYVLNLTPLGTHIDDVVSIVEGHRDWNIARINREQGFMHPEIDRIRPIPGLDERPVIIGEQSIRASAGRYRYALITETIVTIFGGFDANGYLTEVYVWKSSI